MGCIPLEQTELRLFHGCCNKIKKVIKEIGKGSKIKKQLSQNDNLRLIWLPDGSENHLWNCENLRSGQGHFVTDSRPNLQFFLFVFLIKWGGGGA